MFFLYVFENQSILSLPFQCVYIIFYFNNNGIQVNCPVINVSNKLFFICLLHAYLHLVCYFADICDMSFLYPLDLQSQWFSVRKQGVHDLETGVCVHVAGSSYFWECQVGQIPSAFQGTISSAETQGFYRVAVREKNIQHQENYSCSITNSIFLSKVYMYLEIH